MFVLIVFKTMGLAGLVKKKKKKKFKARSKEHQHLQVRNKS